METVALFGNILAVNHYRDATVSIMFLAQRKQEVVDTTVDCRNHAATDNGSLIRGQFASSV